MGKIGVKDSVDSSVVEFIPPLTLLKSTELISK